MSRNAEMIAKALHEYLSAPDGRHYIDFGMHDEPEDFAHLATFLASRNILAVDSLTDEQCDLLGAAWSDDVRAALRRCATEEPE